MTNEVKCTQNKENDMGNTCIITFLKCYRIPPYIGVLPIKLINKIKSNFNFFCLKIANFPKNLKCFFLSNIVNFKFQVKLF